MRVAQTRLSISPRLTTLTLVCAQPEPPDSPPKDRLALGPAIPATPGPSSFCSRLSTKVKLKKPNSGDACRSDGHSAVPTAQPLPPGHGPLPHPDEHLYLQPGFFIFRRPDQGLTIARFLSKLYPAPVLPTGPRVAPAPLHGRRSEQRALSTRGRSHHRACCSPPHAHSRAACLIRDARASVRPQHRPCCSHPRVQVSLSKS